MLAQLLDVSDQVPGGVGVQAGAQVRDRGCAPSAAALIELDQPVGLRVKPAAPPRRAAAARAAVLRNSGLATGAAAHFPVNALIITDVEQARVVRLKARKPFSHDPAG